VIATHWSRGALVVAEQPYNLTGDEPRTASGIPLVGGPVDPDEVNCAAIVAILAEIIQAACVRAVEQARQRKEAA
jgi:hypothetical protein